MPCLQKAIAGQFLQHFYGLYDGNDRSSLAPLYVSDHCRGLFAAWCGLWPQ